MKRIFWKFITWQIFKFHPMLERDYQRVQKIEPMTREEYIAARALGGSNGFYQLGLNPQTEHPFWNKR